MEPSTFRRSHVYHAIHCCAFVGFFILSQIFFPRLLGNNQPKDPLVPASFWHHVVYLVRIVGAVGLLPWSCLTTLGLLCFNAFETQVQSEVKPLTAPFLCFRIVTKGTFPDLVKRNVKNLKELCLRMGLKNFMIHVAANNCIRDLEEDRLVKQTVIPENYCTSTGALYKARSLQYCIEHDDVLNDNDWIVHLDEETVATENSIRGILNFVADGRYQFGQGLLLLIHDKMTNWATSLMECWRVADDMGKLRFQLSVFHRLVVEWKGSFFVCKVAAEKAVSFDHGIEGSITEDGYFGLLATQHGYKFQFIQGEMLDESAASVWDMVQQRKRWIQGGMEMACSREISFGTKVIFLIHFFGVTLTLGGTLPATLNLLFPAPFSTDLVDAMYNYYLFLNFYVQSYGIIMSYLLCPRRGLVVLSLCLVASWFFSFFNFLLGAIAVLWALVGEKGGFYIVKKN